MQHILKSKETFLHLSRALFRSKITIIVLLLFSMLGFLFNRSNAQATELNGTFQANQTIPTPNGVVDWEYFEMNDKHYLVAASHGLATDSKIYELVNGTFIEVQSIPTDRAANWEHFVIDGNHYLAVANYYNGSTGNINSKIYKWNSGPNQFEVHQEIATSRATDWEYFSIGSDHFLVVANFYDGSNYATDSKIYKWDGTLGKFDDTNVFQTIATKGAKAWDHFTIGSDHYLAVANYFDYWSNNQDSKIYKWNGTTFAFLHSIATKGATDIEHMAIDGNEYLAITNYRNIGAGGVNTDSKLYIWNSANNKFDPHQNIPTQGATRLKPFAIGDDQYLAISNNYNGSATAINSKIYKWNETAGGGGEFENFQNIPTNAGYGWAYFSATTAMETNHYLAIANYYDNTLPNLYTAVETQYISPTTTLVSVAWDGSHPSSVNAKYPSISADGRFVAFESDSALVVGDGNNAGDIFLHDRQTGETTLISINSNGTQADWYSYNAAISPDGDHIAFSSRATNLVAGDTNNTDDIFVHNRLTGVTTRVSIASDGTQANGGSGHPSFSIDGRFVAFQSGATTLVADDTNNAEDIFVHDRQTGNTTRVSVVSLNGFQSNGDSFNHYDRSISADGRFVTFSSDATNLVNIDTNNAKDVFVHDRQTGETTRVSVTSEGAQANGYSDYPSISADGNLIAFHSPAPNLNTANSSIYVHNRQTGETRLVSVASSGIPANLASEAPSISGDGRFVSFSSIATTLVSGDIFGYADIFVHELATGETTRVSVASDGSQATYGSNHSIDTFTAISNDGRFIAFSSVASNFVAGDTNNRDIFVRDRGVGELGE